MRSAEDELADRIVDCLFTNGNGSRAQRLVLELPGKKDGGGWSECGAYDQIRKVLAAWFRPQSPTR